MDHVSSATRFSFGVRSTFPVDPPSPLTVLPGGRGSVDSVALRLSIKLRNDGGKNMGVSPMGIESKEIGRCVFIPFPE